MPDRDRVSRSRLPDGLLQTAAIGLGVFLALCAIRTVLLVNDRVLRAVGRALRAAERRLHRGQDADPLPERLLHERDLLRRSLG